MEGVQTSNHVYILDNDHAWMPARLLETSSDTATVSVGSYKDEQSILVGNVSKKTLKTIQLKDYPGQTLPLQNVDEEGKLKTVSDMVDLAFLHEAAILYNLKVRHIQKKPYTRTGDIIIAVNPYQWFHDLYAEELRCQYAQQLVWNNHPTDDLEPHVYETSSLAYRGLAVNNQNQSILVSGESGAGKTETVKILLRDIASIQVGYHDATVVHQSNIVQKVLDSNPLLEAFGNAKTIRNDNSSRFGKYIQLQFECEDPLLAIHSGKNLPSCRLAGSKCDVYLLEKSRVVSHQDEERTYHIMYQLLAAPDAVKCQFWDGLSNTDNETFLYVGYSDTFMIEGMSDADRFEQTLASLALIGIVDDKLQTLMRAICVVLQLGNLVFVVDENDETKSALDDLEELERLADLMGVPTADLMESLTIRTMTARKEVFRVPLNNVQAKDSCDAFAKEIYAKTFLWLVRSINDATCAELNYENKVAEFGQIGLLDIFGFESFETNRFEQLCINYANEKLQQKFTQDIFRSVQAEYEYEGIALGEIKYDDNTDVLDLVEGRMGLIAFLNEECVRPGGSDKGFVSKASAMNKDNPCFVNEKGFGECEFGVNHYAGQVLYTSTGFVNKNTDTLPTDLQDCATKSTNAILANELGNEAMMNPTTRNVPKRKTPKKGSSALPPGRKKGSNLVGETVWSKFRNQLSSLMTNLKTTRTRYIRCIKPNQLKKPLIMQHATTVEQLRCAGVVAAVTISRSAFPNRLEHEVVLDRFKSLFRHGDFPDFGDMDTEHKHQVDRMLTVALKSLETPKDGTVQKAFVMGNTRTYFRAGALEYLENERVRALSKWAVEIQRVCRQFIARTSWKRFRQRTVVVQSLARRHMKRERFKTMKLAAIQMECWYRVVSACRLLIKLRRNHKAVLIQSRYRMGVARSSFLEKRGAAVNMQKIVRGALQRPKYRAALIEKREEAKLENQVLALQRKLEEAEQKRIDAEKAAEEKARLAVVEEHKQVVPVEEKKFDDKSKDGHVSVESSLSDPDKEPAALTEQQQTLMDESGKMLEYLRKEVFRLRSQNQRMRREFDLLKDNNQRLMDANASAGASFAALNQHAKTLSRTNDKLTTDIHGYKQQVQKLSVTQVELKEELKMKQATYVAEVHSRLQYQKALSRIIDVAQDKCRDDRLVEEFLKIADSCEAEYMLEARSPSTPTRTPRRGDSGLMGSLRKIWS